MIGIWLRETVTLCTRRSLNTSFLPVVRFTHNLKANAQPLSFFKRTDSANPITDPSKKRIQRRKLSEEEVYNKPGYWNVAAFATAEEYDLERLKDALIMQNLYIPSELGSNEPLQTGVANAIHAVAKYQVSSENRHLYYFREGSIVMWNFPEVERHAILNFLKPFEDQSYDDSIINQELEIMPYTYSKTSKRSHIHDACIYIACQDKDFEDICLDRYTFSNGMALSVKLGVMETMLEHYIRGIEFVTEDLKYGRPVRINQEEVLRKSGELLALRHSINLSTDFLGTPDFYWDREQLELLYQRCCSYFSIARRTKVMNEKLNHCVELIELLTSYLSDRHHVRLEWMIIILIMVEVGFEIIHYLKI